MRRRRSAFHADSHEEFLAKVKTSDVIESNPRTQTLDSSVYNQQKSKSLGDLSFPSASDKAQASQDQNNLLSTNQMKDGCSMHFEGLTYNRDEIDSDSDSDSSGLSRRLSETDDSAGADLVKTQKKVFMPVKSTRVIVIGDNQVEKTLLINYLFDDDQGEQANSIRDPIDLRIRAHVKEDVIIKYHMWIKSCTCTDQSVSDKLKSIYMVYYKTVSSFILVYSIEDRRTFTSLSQAIKSLINDVGPQRFKGVLIGLRRHSYNPKQDSDEREVSTLEGEQLKQDSGLNAFMEVDLSDNSQRELILGVMENLKKEYVRVL